MELVTFCVIILTNKCVLGGYSMRRKDKEIIDKEKIEQIIESCDCCRIGLVDKDKPYIIPLNFAYINEGNKQLFYFHGSKIGKKIDLINKNKYAGFEMDTNHMLKKSEEACKYSFKYQSIIGTGIITIVTDLNEKINGLKLLMKHYSDKDNWSFNEKIIEEIAVIKLEVEEITCKENQ